MTFFDDAAVDAAAIFQELGENVTYTPSGGAPVTVTALWRESDLAEELPTDGRVARRRGIVELLAANAPSPDEEDSFVIGLDTWAVERITAVRPTAVFQVFHVVQRRFGGSDANAR